MKVLNLRCGLGHGFEGWFANDEDHAQQHAAGLLTCPVCGRGDVEKMPSAPRLNLGASAPASSVAPARTTGTVPVPAVPGGSESLTGPHRGELVNALRKLVAHSRDVGDRFAEQAMAMHHGLQEPEPIRGRATPDQARALQEEGVGVLALPDWPGLTENLQ